MKGRAVWTCVASWAVAAAMVPPAGAADVDPDLVDKAFARGQVRVLVTMAAAWEPEGRLAASRVAAQRTAVARKGQDLAAIVRAGGGRVLRRYDELPLLVAEATPAVLSELAASPDVAAIHEDVPYRTSLSASSPLVEASQAWSWQRTGNGATVAVLDTGIRASHTFFGGRVVGQACFSTTTAGTSTHCPNGADAQVGPGAAAACTYTGDCFHGTHVAGIAAGSSASFSGVGRAAGIYAVQVFSRFNSAADCNPSPAPCTMSFISDQIEALNHVYAQRTSHNFASVNMSLGGGQFTSPCDGQPQKPAIDQLRAVGIATVIAAGNDGFTSALSSPACISSAVSVGSTTKADGVSSFSNAASFMSLWAPGSSINSASTGSDTAFVTASGTSMAAPHVAGAWSLLKQHKPGASVTEIAAALDATGLSITDSRSGMVTKRRIRVFSALRALCPAGAIAPGGSVGGALAATDCRAWTRDAYGDSYTFNGVAGQSAAFLVESLAFDAYVQLLDPNGNLIAQDDNGGGGSQARIPAGGGLLSLPSSGTYTVIATSAAPVATGGYTLSFQNVLTPTPTPVPTATPTPLPTATPTPPPAPPGAVALEWTNTVGVTAGTGQLTRGGTAAGWTAGAVSVRVAGEGDAGVEFTAVETNTYRLLGLSHGDSSQDYTDVDFAIYPAANGYVYIFEGGVNRGAVGMYRSGDRLAVEVVSGIVRYKVNGAILYANLSPTLVYPLRVDTALYSPGATFVNVVGYGTLASNTAPRAITGSPYRWTAGQPITFDGRASYDSDGTLASYAWAFGDGGTGTGPTPTHAYSAPGTYVATLTVTDNVGATDTATATVTVTAAVATGSVTWTAATGVAASAGSLQKTAAAGWNAGAVSTQTLAAGDGYVQTMIGETSTYRLFGFSNGNSSASYDDIDFGFYPAADGNLYVFERGVSRGAVGTYASGDRLRVSIDGGVVRYLRNGRVLRASSDAPVYPLLVDTALYSTGATLSSVVITGGTPVPPVARAGGPYEWSAGQPIHFDGTASTDADGIITSYSWAFGDGTTAAGASPQHAYAAAGAYTATLTVTDDTGASHSATATVAVDARTSTAVTWTSAAGVSVSGGTITKTGPDGWDAGAVSTQSIAAGEGHVACTVTQTSAYRLFGLGVVDASRSYEDVDFGLYPAGNGLLYVFEGGVNRGSFGPYATGDRLRVGIRGGVLRYVKNGRVLYASATAPAYPLRVDTSFYTSGGSLGEVVLATP